MILYFSQLTFVGDFDVIFPISFSIFETALCNFLSALEYEGLASIMKSIRTRFYARNSDFLLSRVDAQESFFFKNNLTLLFCLSHATMVVLEDFHSKSFRV